MPKSPVTASSIDIVILCKLTLLWRGLAYKGCAMLSMSVWLAPTLIAVYDPLVNLSLCQ